jgi:hypothetical protein
MQDLDHDLFLAGGGRWLLALGQVDVAKSSAAEGTDELISPVSD